MSLFQSMVTWRGIKNTKKHQNIFLTHGVMSKSGKKGNEQT